MTIPSTISLAELRKLAGPPRYGVAIDTASDKIRGEGEFAVGPNVKEYP